MPFSGTEAGYTSESGHRTTSTELDASDRRSTQQPRAAISWVSRSWLSEKPNGLTYVPEVLLTV